jgi:hypothetical protein
MFLCALGSWDIDFVQFGVVHPFLPLRIPTDVARVLIHTAYGILLYEAFLLSAPMIEQIMYQQTSRLISGSNTV